MSNLNSQIVDIINNFLKENKLVDARTCEGEFLGMHSSLTVGGAHEVVEELEKLIAQQVREARLDELIGVRGWTEYEPDPKYSPAERFHIVPYTYLTKRIEELKRSNT